jgi:hypothetical protein
MLIFQCSCYSLLIVHLFFNFLLFCMTLRKAYNSELVLLVHRQLPSESQMNSKGYLLNQMTVSIRRLEFHLDQLETLT